MWRSEQCRSSRGAEGPYLELWEKGEGDGEEEGGTGRRTEGGRKEGRQEGSTEGRKEEKSHFYLLPMGSFLLSSWNVSI